MREATLTAELTETVARTIKDKNMLLLWTTGILNILVSCKQQSLNETVAVVWPTGRLAEVV